MGRGDRQAEALAPVPRNLPQTPERLIPSAARSARAPKRDVSQRSAMEVQRADDLPAPELVGGEL
jgi:hypothetical protein